MTEQSGAKTIREKQIAKEDEECAQMIAQSKAQKQPSTQPQIQQEDYDEQIRLAQKRLVQKSNSPRASEYDTSDELNTGSDTSGTVSDFSPPPEWKES